MEYAEKINFSARIPTKVWAVVSFGTAILVWYLLSIDAKTSRSFPFLNEFTEIYLKKEKRISGETDCLL